MKKVIGIYHASVGDEIWDDEIVRKEGAGGSETWAVEIASEFQRRGFHVILFCNTPIWKFAKDGAEYVPTDMFKRRCEYQHFDYFISSRTTEEINSEIRCQNIYVLSHDMFVLNAMKYNDLKLDKVKKVAVLSEYQKNNFKNNLYNGLREEQVFLTFNGYNCDTHENVCDETKENSMIWSSATERGLGFFVEHIFPKIKKEIPDFKLYVCGYNSRGQQCDDNDIIYLGRLGKKELSDYQKKCKIWIYPNIGRTDNRLYFHETFCITAVENAMAGNAIVCLPAGGLTTTLNGYSGFICRDLIEDWVIYTERFPIHFDMVKENNMEECFNRIAEQSVSILKDDNLRKKLSNEAMGICKKYTWKNCVDGWLKEWGLLYV